MPGMRAGSMLSVAAGIAFLLSGAVAARAETVDVALVLAADVSRSIDTDEFHLQRQGYAAALTSPSVLQAIHAGAHGAIAVSFVEWSGADEQAVVVDWAVIRDAEGAAAFADKLRDAPRSFVGRTSISAGLDFAMGRLKASGVAADRKVIDVSGDGTNNAGRPVTEATACLATTLRSRNSVRRLVYRSPAKAATSPGASQCCPAGSASSPSASQSRPPGSAESCGVSTSGRMVPPPNLLRPDKLGYDVGDRIAGAHPCSGQCLGDSPRPNSSRVPRRGCV